MKTPLKHISLLAAAALSFTGLNAATTQPVGYSTWTIEAGTGTARALTSLALPLYVPATTIQGASAGTIASLTSNTITVTDAGWAAEGLSQASAPYLLRVTSGSAEGRNLLISTQAAQGNTSDTVTIDILSSDVTDLTTLGITQGTDTFEITECDTLLSLLGSDTDGAIIGGSDFNSADNVWLLDSSGIWKKYFYDTDVSQWVQNIRGFPIADNTALLPDNGLLFFRLQNTSTDLVVTGTVPDTDRKVTINSIGLTFIANSYPVDIELSAAGFENIPGWVSSTNSSTADIVFIRDTGSWKRFFHNGTNWVQNVRGFPISDTFGITQGSAVFLQKKSATAGDAEYSQVLPYTL